MIAPGTHHIFLILTLCWTGLFTQRARAQARLPDKAITQYTHRSWQIEDGLPQNTIYDIAQTPDGYLWLATMEGVVRFDGVTFTVFDRSNTLLESNRILSLLTDREGSLWIGTEVDGLYRLAEGRFQAYAATDASAISIVREIYEDRAGRLWIGTGDGIYRLDPGAPPPQALRPVGLTGLEVWSIYEDRRDNLWIGTTGGLYLFDKGRFTLFAEGYIYCIAEDREENLWMGTEDGRLLRLRHGAITTYTEADGLTNSAIQAIHEDRKGNLWLGTTGGGLNRFKEGVFTSFTTEEGLSDDVILSLFEDREGTLWVGTDSGGLSQLVDQKITTFSTEEGLSNNFALGLFEDREGALWIGTQNGLNRYQDGTLSAYLVEDPQSSKRQVVWAIHEDRRGNLWIGTYAGFYLFTGNRLIKYQGEEGPFLHVQALAGDHQGAVWIGTANEGLFQYDHTTFTRYSAAQGLASDNVRYVYEDSRRLLWVGTDDGLHRYDNQRFTRFTTKDGLAHNAIRTMHEDEAGHLWIGTLTGLSLWKEGRFLNLSDQTGFLNHQIHHILEDDRNDLWMSTNKGVFRVSRTALLDYAEGRGPFPASVAYGLADGMKSRECNGGFQHAGWKSSDGTLWFPTIRGVTRIESQRFNDRPPHVVIERLVVDGEAVEIGNRLRLPQGSKSLAFDYAGLSFVAPEKMQFNYKLEGYDDWQDAGTRRTAYYTNLSPGAYTFRVKASNSDGIWHETGAALSFELKPYFYQTRWFYVISGLMLAFFGVALYRLRIFQLRRRERALEALIDERTYDLLEEKQKTEQQAQRLAQLEQLKSRFFANISHEFRTPLTLTIGPLERALSGAYGTVGSELKKQLSRTLRQSRHLLKLVNELLALSKLEAGKMDLRTRHADIVSFLREVVLSFAPLAERKDITLQFQTRQARVFLYFEPDKIEKVFLNLLSNAFKFTEAGGRIRVLMQETVPSGATRPATVDISVKDTGCGIPEEELPYVFDRFHQADHPEANGRQGTGIGLALAKELIVLHGGTVRVVSEVGFGSEFIVSLPTGKAHLHPEQIVEAAEAPATGEERPAHPAMDVAPEAAVVSAPDATPVPEETGAPCILVVEDNPDVNDYIKEILEEQFEVVQAYHGAEGLEQAKKRCPDLVVSDVRMPEMDGLTLCRTLKSDPHLNHIPVILLTARVSIEDKLEGLKTGVEDYLPKPFDSDELLIKVQNLIKTRKALRQRFSHEITLQPGDIVIASSDEHFLERARQIVEANLGDSDFTVKDLGGTLGVSTRQLQRKLRALTDMSPAGFIRHIRLQRASQLLKQHAGNVSEIAYDVGFNDPAYFAKLFRQAFGMSPSQYGTDGT
ncbi:MAG: two-component regulator propeller domain-containing protein [Rhodothermales bacterium]